MGKSLEHIKQNKLGQDAFRSRSRDELYGTSLLKNDVLQTDTIVNIFFVDELEISLTIHIF